MRWIRLHYAYPRVFPDELIDVMATEPKIAKYLDMPLQHASDKLLLSMKRGRDSKFLRELLAQAARARAGLTMRTSLIVGLPGETEEDFELLKEFVQEQRFERLGVLPVLGRRGHRRVRLAGQGAAEDHRAPLARADGHPEADQPRAEQDAHRPAAGGAGGGRQSPETEHLLVGRHEGQAPEIDGQVYINDGMAYPGELVTVEVTEAHDYDLVGRVVERPDPRKRALTPRAAVPTWTAPR